MGGRTISSVGVAVVLAAAVLAAGCGGSANRAAQSTSDRRQDAALKWAKCMREHGVDMPDPKVGANGLVQVGPRPGSSGMPPEAAMRRASRSCDHFLARGGPGRGPSATERRKMEEQALRFARCMRQHGVDVPDPQFSSGGHDSFSIRIRPGQGPDSPAFRKAQKACGGPLIGRAKVQ
jgi:hypothetical protein